jgi:hypothetical protein
MADPDIDRLLFDAYRFEQLGVFETALAQYREVMRVQPDNFAAATRRFRLERDLRRDPPGPLTLVWQKPPTEPRLETTIRRYLSGLSFTEIVDGNYREFHDGSLVVDHNLRPESLPYYSQLMMRGYRFGLVHTADEYFIDDCTAYQFANFVIRQYWSIGHANNRRTMAVPLGTFPGFVADPSKTAAERKHLWSFAGELRKSTRPQMIAAMQTLPGGFVHVSGASNEEHALVPLLTMPEYSALMADTVFSPCPAGWANLDSFRVYESLEAGCIPIVERRPGYDYFTILLGPHPMIRIDDWSEAPAAIRALQEDPAKLEARRIACIEWWLATRQTFIDRVAEHCMRGLRGGVASASAHALV